MLVLSNLLFAAAQVAPPTIYEVGYDPASPGRVRVEITAPEGCTPRVLVMPRAIPMGYGEQHYDRYVSDVQAHDAEGAALEVLREEEGPRWRLGGTDAEARRVSYVVDVEAMEHEVLGASDASRARPGYMGLLGYSVFATFEGLESSPVELVARAPDDWPVFTTLAPQAPPLRGEAHARAADFYSLADSQLVLGPRLQVLRLEAARPLFLAQYAERPSDAQALGAQAVRALDALVKYFGSAPFPHYTVQVEFLEPLSPQHQYGFSMEHLESCTIYFDTTRVLAPGAAPEDPPRHLYNLAHHMAHAWIPKRCAGPGYFPWTWEIAPVLDSIWFSEGWGQYVAASALADEGGLGDDYRRTLVQRRFRESLADAPPFLEAMDLVQVSRIASTRYSEDFRTGRNVFSRGGLMAFEIDEAIRAASDGKHSLRDVVRRLMREGESRPLDLDRLPAWCREETGVDIGAVVARWLGPLR